mmetsp:Transcript_3283/g.8590  ORF Transcript_3283/g.8590 Transcript_3283/m.8590 type:complete len:413 (-) Transcript_3283:228-1466(-)
MADEVNLRKEKKDKYAFWETQPVAQFDGDAGEGGSSADTETKSLEREDGPIDALKTPADVKKEPYNLPANFEWCECDMNDNATREEVYALLVNNYVEDDDEMFRFNYSAAFLKWALQPPGYKLEWHIGVRATSSRKLVGFITAIPATIRVRSASMPMVEINFLCVHKKLRAKRLAPVLIKEITRRVNLHDIWQASYTAGVVLPKPVATARYYHRSINPKKLIEINFSRLSSRMTMARTIKLYKLPDTPATPGLRPMVEADVPQVTGLLAEYLHGYQLAPQLDEEEVRHWLMPVEDVIDCYVADDGTGNITDFLSFYTLPSSVLHNPQHDILKAAYMYYTVANTVPVAQLMNDALILARDKNYDVFNALDIFQNQDFLKELKFGIGDGHLQFYLYNYYVAGKLKPQDVGLVLL